MRSRLRRQDPQLRLSGFRIDLDDIEARLQRAVSGSTGIAAVVKDDILVARCNLRRWTRRT